MSDNTNPTQTQNIQAEEVPQAKRMMFNHPAPQFFQQQPMPMSGYNPMSQAPYFQEMTVHMLYHELKDMKKENEKLSHRVDTLENVVKSIQTTSVTSSDEKQKKKIHRKPPKALWRCHALATGTGKQCSRGNQFDSKVERDTILEECFEEDGRTPTMKMYCNQHKEKLTEGELKFVEVKIASSSSTSSSSGKRKRKSDESDK